MVASPFGPRLSGTPSYEFHKGIDLLGELGDPIYAIADGEVQAVWANGQSGTPYPNGGNVVILRHLLDEPFSLGGAGQFYYYSLYMHLDEISVSSGDPLVSGEQLGTMGRTGAASTTMLHFETRIATTCSLEFQTANPGSTCAQYGFDPHVNPFYLLDAGDEGEMTASVSFDSATTSIRVTAPRTKLNLVSVRINGVGINLTTREGINLDDMDNPTVAGITLRPYPFLISSPDYDINIEFENAIIPASGDDQYSHIVEIYDAWGGGKIYKFVDR